MSAISEVSNAQKAMMKTLNCFFNLPLWTCSVRVNWSTGNMYVLMNSGKLMRKRWRRSKEINVMYIIRWRIIRLATIARMQIESITAWRQSDLGVPLFTKSPMTVPTTTLPPERIKTKTFKAISAIEGRKQFSRIISPKSMTKPSSQMQLETWQWPHPHGNSTFPVVAVELQNSVTLKFMRLWVIFSPVLTRKQFSEVGDFIFTAQVSSSKTAAAYVFLPQISKECHFTNRTLWEIPGATLLFGKRKGRYVVYQRLRLAYWRGEKCQFPNAELFFRRQSSQANRWAWDFLFLNTISSTTVTVGANNP